MLNANKATGAIVSPVRHIEAFVNVYEGGALIHTFTHKDRIISFEVQRTGEEGKFFGFGFCQRLSLQLIDKHKELNLSTACYIEVGYTIEDENITPYPYFKISECRRDENTNELSITAYDAIYNVFTVNDIGVTLPATVADYATLSAETMGLAVVLPESANLTLSYEQGANYEGTETLRSLLDDIAEVTQTIYYINNNGELVFKRLTANADLSISREDYITLDSSTARRLATICHITELGDNVSASLAVTGSTQYIRDNPFIELREDIATILENALTAIGGLTINQFDMEWRGNPLLEIGDCIALEAKDGETLLSFLLDDTITYEGYLKERTRWAYKDGETETANPSTIGEALNQTFARVDKVNKQVDIVVSSVAENTNSISTLQLTTGSISANVAHLDAIVSTQITSDDVEIAVRKEIAENGVDKVVTNTGFVFDETGLTISKSGTEMETVISEDGMSVSKNDTEMLKADNTGVIAVNLHATTYLIVGENSRFENYGNNRTGCFWIGG